MKLIQINSNKKEDSVTPSKRNELAVIPIKIYIFISIILISLFFIFNDMMVDAMERDNADIINQRNENIRTQLVYHRHEVLSATQLNEMIQTINRLDPIRDARMIREIQQYLNETGIDINNFLDPHVQHTLMGDEGNSGNPVSSWTWQSFAKSIAIGAGIFIIGYLIIRNWESIHETFFDITRSTWNNVPMQALSRIIPNLAQQHPGAARGLYHLMQSQVEE